jgi:hypothetical protein
MQFKQKVSFLQILFTFGIPPDLKLYLSYLPIAIEFNPGR